MQAAQSIRAPATVRVQTSPAWPFPSFLSRAQAAESRLPGRSVLPGPAADGPPPAFPGKQPLPTLAESRAGGQPAPAAAGPLLQGPPLLAALHAALRSCALRGRIHRASRALGAPGRHHVDQTKAPSGLSLGEGDTGHPVVDAAALFAEHAELLQGGVLPRVLIGVLRGERRGQPGWPLAAGRGGATPGRRRHSPK